MSKTEKMDKLAREVLLLSRNTLLVNLRFLDAALSQFAFFPIEESTLLTDGKHILYNPRHILENYKTAKANLLTALGAVFVFGAMTVTMLLKASTSLAAISVVFGVIMTILSLI